MKITKVEIPKDSWMKKPFIRIYNPVLGFIIGCFILLGTIMVTPAQADAYHQNNINNCLGCHSNPEIGDLELPNGDRVSLYIDQDILATSIHGSLGIECDSCHTTIPSFPHPPINFQSARELSRSYYLTCQRCHSDNYDLTMDSVHAQIAESGNLAAPICTDCHGAHNIVDPDIPRTRISQTCGNCHAEIYSQYQQSIHGSALVEGNPDVPVCTDCHGVHNIQDPRTSQFRIAEPELCAGCHANAELMQRYNLSADVYDIYQLSWHGIDLSVYKARWPTIWHDSAICTDCHGVHDIRSADDPASSVSQTNLLATCQKCHPGVGPNWTGAWTGHYRVSLERTPFVYYTQAFYTSFTPYVLIICGAYVLLQFVRNTVDRVRRSLNEPQ
jgi:predicted CXXCH cytochrome family protein